MKIRLIILIISILTFIPNVDAKRFTLVIDPGHGGHDAGAIGAFSKEKDINLKTALALGRYLERYSPDVNVIFTRKTDVFIPLLLTSPRKSMPTKPPGTAMLSSTFTTLPLP